jgi:SAM-dependent methyltransferase
MLPFQSGVFDLAFTRLLLRHIPRPERAVAELIRVVRPGGMVLVEDCDDGSLVLEPYPAGFAEALAARHASLRRRGAEPMLARRLPAMLRRTGLVSVALRAVVVSTEDIGANAFARIVLGPATEAIDADLLEDSQVLAARQSIAAWSESAVAFGMTTLLILRGFRA